jgi:hypothetical protein
LRPSVPRATPALTHVEEDPLQVFENVGGRDLSNLVRGLAVQPARLEELRGTLALERSEGRPGALAAIHHLQEQHLGLLQMIRKRDEEDALPDPRASSTRLRGPAGR